MSPSASTVFVKTLFLAALAPFALGQSVTTINEEGATLDEPLTIPVTGNDISRLQIGAGGEGSASFSSDITFDTTNATGGYGTLDVGRGSESRGTVDHSAGTVNLNGGAFQIGIESGYGSYTLSGAASVLAHTLYVGESAGGTGTIRVQGFSELIVGTDVASAGQVFVGSNGGSGQIIQESADSFVSIVTENGLIFGHKNRSGSVGGYQLDSGTLVMGATDGVRFGGHRETTGAFVQNGGTSDFLSAVIIGDRGEGSFTLNDGEATLRAGVILGNMSTGSGTLQVNGGTLTLSGGIQVGEGSGKFMLAGGTLKAGSDAISSAMPISLAGGTTSTIDTNGYTFGVLAVSSEGGVGNLVKIGEGILVAYSADIGSVEVVDGFVAFLSANIAEVTVHEGGMFTMIEGTITGDLTLLGGTIAFLVGNSTQYSNIQVLGDVYGSGILQIQLQDGGGWTPEGNVAFQLWDAAATSVFTAFDLPEIDGFVWDTSAFYDTGIISLQAIPEPSTYAMLAGLSVMGLAVWRRRRVAA